MRTSSVVLSWLLAAAVLSSCNVTEDEVRSYSRYSNGKSKLFVVMTEPEYSTKLKRVAALELFGMRALAELEEGLKSMPQQGKPEVVSAIVETAEKALQSANQQKQITAKDALYLTLPYLSGDKKTEVEDLLIRWTTEKFTLRFKFGRFDTGKILTKIGARAVPHMLALIRSGKDTVRASRILKALEAPQAVEQATQMVIDSLEKNIMENSEPKILALGTLGGPKALDYLNKLAANNKTAGAWDRLKAMDELLKLADKSSLETARSIVSDSSAQFDLRRKALELLGKVGGPEALSAVLKALSDPDLRDKAWDLALRFGGTQALDQMLSKYVKPDWKLDKNEINDLVSSIAKLGKSSQPALLSSLKKCKKNVPACIISVRALGEFGSRDSIPKLQAHIEDDIPLDQFGFPGTTIGVQATTAINKISKR
ncbi:MAG: hypothetical protein GXP49_04975 [Deltaproteobacteria bacterium]|nr:hypothetical protein [Deltaproteobacteria bacterium]